LRENLTISSYGEGLETGRANRVPRQFLTRQMFFNVLKNACRVETLQLSQMERVEKALVLYMVVSWRIARLMRLGRTCPDLDASLFFEADEIHGAHVLSKKPRPKKPPTLNQMIRMIASLGGFLGRKGDGEPGAKTLWIGMQRVMDAVITIQILRDGYDTSV
jgi:hypothetical protein